jgi:drug/metabolite transporter (DMT)-like permease
MTDTNRAWLYLHISVFAWGFTAILGRMIDLAALPLVWWRVVLVAVPLWFFLPKAELRAISRQKIGQLLGIGMLVGLHWLCFYGAVKLANASIGVVSMAVASLFTAILEPILLKKRIKWHEVGIGLLVLPGMYLVVQNIEWSMMTGFAVGILGALLATIFSILNKKLVDDVSASIITFVEMSAIIILFGLILPFFFWENAEAKFIPTGRDWPLLLVFSIVCTLIPFQLSLFSLKRLSAFSTNLVINLEPVYGVFLAGVLLNEHKNLNVGFYIGVGIVLLAVFSHPFLRRIFEKND